MATATDILTKLKTALDGELEGVEVTEWPAGSQNPPCLYSVRIGEYKIDVRPDKTIIWGANGEELMQDTKELATIKAAIATRLSGQAASAPEPEVKVSSMDDLNEKLMEILNEADGVEVKGEMVTK